MKSPSPVELSDAPVWMLYCTISPVFYFIGRCTDEIEAVRLFQQHVLSEGRHHIPYMYMCRLPKDISPYRYASELAHMAAVDRPPNMFRLTETTQAQFSQDTTKEMEPT